MSTKDWEVQIKKLRQIVKKDKKKFNEAVFYTASYDSPWVPGHRRTNEVWLEKVDCGNGNTVQDNGQVRNAEDELEMLPYEVIETNDNYELRQYKSQKWVCTMMDNIDPTKDPMNGWEKKFNNDPYLAMSSSEYNDQPASKMFKKLFKYITGVNKMAKEVEMTRPVIVTHLPKESGKERQITCFWLGSEWQGKTAPQPLEDDVRIMKSKPLKVFVRKFEGFPMSYNEFYEQYMKLKEKLKTDGRQIDESVWMHASYNSPFTPRNRMNEVFVPQI